MGRLEGKVAIVTGGAQGIGAASARRLVAEGASVIIADINDELANKTAAAIAQEGGKVSAVYADVSKEDDTKAMIEAAVQTYGGLDILHNNATLGAEDHAKDGPVATMDPEYWALCYAVNVIGPALACKHGVPYMVERGGGSIINTASGLAMLGDFLLTAYGSAKRSIEALTMHLATQHGKQGIRVNAISPGTVLTEGLRRTLSDEMLASIERHNLTPYHAEPADLAAVVAFLASDDSRYITGQTIKVDGGFGAHQPFFAEVMAEQKEDWRK